MAVVVFVVSVGPGDGELVRALAEQGHDRAGAHRQRAEEHEDPPDLQRGLALVHDQVGQHDRGGDDAPGEADLAPGEA